MRSSISLILLGTIAVSACAHDPRSAAPIPAPDLPAPAPAPISASEVTVENLLRWPLEGPAGFDKVEAGLHQVLKMKPLRAQQFRGGGPVRLADGYVLLFAWIQRPAGTVSIGLAQEPCVSPENAKELIGAIQNSFIHDMHGIDRGKSYSIMREGVWVTLTTTPQTYRCVDSIQIRPARKINP